MNRDVYSYYRVKFIYADNIKDLHYWTFVRESTGDVWIPRIEGQ